jgi:predicted  nucleic acid-binding Zn-ribbon protein
MQPRRVVSVVMLLRELHALLSDGRDEADVARVLGELPGEVAAHYRRISGRRAPLATLVEGHCPVCRLRVPAQLENAARRGDGYLICPHCSRILLLGPPDPPLPRAA